MLRLARVLAISSLSALCACSMLSGGDPGSEGARSDRSLERSGPVEVESDVDVRVSDLQRLEVSVQPINDFVFKIEGEGALRRYVSVRGRSQPADRESGLQVVLPPGDYTVSARLPGGAPVRVNVTLPMPAGMALSPLRLP